MKERPKAGQIMRQTGVYSLVSLLVWQPILVRAEIPAAELPQANVDWVSQGAATRVVTGADMTVKQVSDRVSLQWDSFNIGKDASVKFEQPNSSSIALNKVGTGGTAAASRIEGKLSANGIVYIVDRNGVIFGKNSVVDVASLVATALDVDESLVMNESFVKAIEQGKAAFEGGAAEGASIVLEGSVEGTEGARIIAGKGGSVFLLAPKIETQKGSSITTPDGQTILAASKDRVYMAASQDQDLRGILVEVNSGGDIDHAGKIVAERGNITLAALNIEQKGQLTATTSVDANGTIRLLARDTVNTSDIGRLQWAPGNKDYELEAGALAADGDLAAAMRQDSVKVAHATRTGSIEFHEGSVTQVLPDTSSKRAADGNPQPVSFVEATGKTIDVNGGATITSRGGVVSLVATDDPRAATKPERNDSRITLHKGSRIDVSGLSTAQIEMERNSLEVELRGDELKDSPLQRNDPAVRGQTAHVDIRNKDSIEFANISAYVDKIERPVEERLSEGGKVNLYSQGSVDFQNGAVVDVSGGAVNYKAGYIKESRLVDRNGNIHFISDADPNRDYVALLDENERYDARWNITEKLKSSMAGSGKGTFVAGYTEGKDAGSFSIMTNNIAYDGTVLANTITGPYQRTPDSAVGGGSIKLDLQSLGSSTQAIQLLAEADFQQFLQHKANGTAPANTTAISVERFNNSADSLTISGRGNSLMLAEGAHLRLDGGGTLNLNTKGGDVLVQGDITNKGGDVKLKAGALDSSDNNRRSLTVASGSVIDTSGNWVNDNPLLKPDLLAPIRMNAGNIDLSADGDVIVRDGSRLNANGGAWLSSSGKLSAGVGGDIRAAAGNRNQLDPARIGRLVFEGEASSYALGEGGELSLSAGGFRIGDALASTDDLTISMTPEFFRQGGFSKISLDAGLSGIEIADGTRIDLVGERYQLKGLEYRLARSSEDLAPLVNVVSTSALPATQRAGVDLSLNSTENGSAKSADGIRMGSGSLINGLPAARINFSATGGSIDVGGSIVAQGGSVDLTVNPNTSQDFDPSLAIRLREGSLIDVSATTQEGIRQPSGMVDREYHDGGSISLTAAGGYVLGEEGSRLRADGALSKAQYLNAKSARIESETIALDAGSISLSASEGMLFNTDLSARSASPAGRAGSLDVTVTSKDRSPATFNPGDGRKDYELEIRLTGNDLNNVFLQTLLNSNNIESAISGRADGHASGVAYLNVDALNAGEFGHIGLHTVNDTDRQSETGIARPETRITFATEKTLTAIESIRLETPAIVTNGVAASVAAPYVAIGTRFTDDANSRAGGALPVSGSFTASASFIDLQGDIAFRDAAQVNLRSHGDIRLRGGLTNESSRDVPTGSLRAYGDVDLLASQVYAATQTSYTFDLPSANAAFKVRNQSDGAFAIDKDYSVYSALGTLTVNADHIVQQGTLKAPFGTVNLNGRQSLVLDSGSKTSVSGESQTVIFGEVQADGSWLYPIDPSKPHVISGLTEKNVQLKSPSLEQREGAVVDISGGGDLLAYEFVPGPGGSKDVLSYNGSFAGAGESFAIVPGYGSQWAPYDAVEMKNFPYAVGDTVRFENVAGLNPGIEYAILPARYALLPGAYLVTPQKSAIQPGTKITNLAGAKVVAGKLGNAGSGGGDSQWSAFTLEPGSVAFSRSELKLYSANGFFDAAGTRPKDAGRVVYDAVNRLDIDGDILASVAGSGVGGRMDVNAADIRLVGGKTSTGGIQLVADELQKLNVDSILLGGVRTRNSDGTSIAVGANNVTVAGDVDLSVSELLLTGTQGITIETGAHVSADRVGRTVGGPVAISGNGALLQASVGDAVQVLRSNADGSSGSLNIQAGASVMGQGALVLDATGSALVAGTIDTAGTAGFGSSRIVLGADQVDSGMALTQAAIDNLSARNLVLASLTSIDLASDFTVDTGRLTLDAAAINAVGSAPMSASFNAADGITLKNSSGAMAVDVAATGSQLSFNTRQLDLVGNESKTTQKLGGFDAVTISAQQGTRASGDFALASSGDLTLATGRLDANAGADLDLRASGDLSVMGAGTATADALDGLAARFNLSGRNVTLDTQVKAASGVIALQAEQNLDLGEHAVLDVAGKVFNFAGDTVVSDAGTISLAAKQGNIRSQSGALIDVSSPHAAAASGTLQLSASNGEIVLGSAPVVNRAPASTGGVLKVDVAQANNIETLLPQLAGFGEEQTWRARNGDLTLAQNAVVKAESIEFSVDSGSLQVDGRLDASGKDGGSIGLYARDTITLGSTARLDASAASAQGDGGSVVMSSRQGFVALADNSAINVSGNGAGESGQIKFVAARNSTNDDVNFTDSGVNIIGADSVVVSGVKRYETSDVDQSFLDTVVLPETTQFMAAMQGRVDDAAGRFANLVQTLGDVFEVAPGVELYSQGDMTVSGDVNLAPIVEMDPNTATPIFGSDAWRFGEKATPGFLSILSTGNLTVNGKISDGFVTLGSVTGVTQTAPIADRSWSLTLAAGADNASANSTQVLDQGDLILASGSVVRTGTGDVTIAAGGNLKLEDGSAIYTGGLADYVNDAIAGSMPDAGTIDSLQWAFANLTTDGTRIFYGHKGGDIQIDVRRNVISEGAAIAHTEWFNRLDGIYQLLDSTFSPQPKYLSTWGVNYDKFANGIATLGGGNIQLNAGGDVVNLTLAAPTTAMQTGANPFDGNTPTNQVLIRGGGDITLNAGHDILSGNYLVSDGTLAVTAGGAIGRTSTSSHATQIAYGIADMHLKARDTIELTRAVDQSMSPISDLQSMDPSLQNFYFTDESADLLHMQSLVGDVAFSPDTGSADAVTLNSILPAKVTAEALDGSVRINGPLGIEPNRHSDLTLYSAEDIVFEGDHSSVLMSGVPADRIPTRGNAYHSSDTGESLLASLGLMAEFVYPAAGLPSIHAGETADPIRLVTIGGDITSAKMAAGPRLRTSKSAEIVAGRDIRNVGFSLVNTEASDVSVVSAGRDFVVQSQRESTGEVVAGSNSKPIIQQAGPGTLLVTAGRDISLGTSSGIQTVGDTINPALADNGADVMVLAGLSSTPDFARFTDLYINGPDKNNSLNSFIAAAFNDLTLNVDDIQTLLGLSLSPEQLAELPLNVPATLATALSSSDTRAMTDAQKLFLSLSRDNQIRVARITYERGNERQGQVLAYNTLLNEVKRGGSEDSNKKSISGFDPDVDGFARSRAAIASLFPADKAWQGDLSLVFSTINTTDGGDISILTPGGGVDVGLPISLPGVSKEARELGIIATRTGDLNVMVKDSVRVNQSRTFSLDGDIMMWASQGDIDAGRGAKTATGNAAPTVTVDSSGKVVVDYGAVIAGSGIRGSGDVYLFAPSGTIDAGDAGIGAKGNITLVAQQVLGADNIDVGGVSIGVPTNTGVSAGVMAAGSLGSAATSASMGEVADQADGDEGQDAEQVAFLTVEIIGLGD